MSDPQLEPNKRFTATQRLLTAKQYKQVFTNPVKATSKDFTLLACSNSCNHPRLGLIVAKKNVRFAVDRNRLKRLVRESFRHQQSLLPAIDCVILARRGSSERSNQVLFGQLEALWEKIAKRCAGS
ncbi:ribonuclease P protein component [Kangiella sp. TOML190]|uniref:ribonuclease P protein component n=1 Tax=Kangiella sp. TOML190 TaxID=2931351 RepID=UPI00203E341D|nr:ribonuclease P protein component [Kangiella sp. TOML190]